jgi:centromere protein C
VLDASLNTYFENSFTYHDHKEIVVTPEMLDPRTVGAGDYRFQKVFSEGDFLASGVLYLPKGAHKPNKNSNASAMV